MRDAWLYAKKKEATRDMGAALVELGYRPRYVGPNGTLVPTGDGAELRPPEVAIVLTASGEELELGLLGRLRDARELSDAPVMVALEPEHLRNSPQVALSHELLVTPFSLEELRVRVARATRDLGPVADTDLVRAGALELNLASYQASIDGCPVELRHMEFQLLKFLITHPGRVFTREALLSRVWGYDYYGGARTVDVHVRRLRLKLGESGERIRTLRSVGYLFDRAEELVQAVA